MKLRYSLLVILLIFAIGWNFYDFNEDDLVSIKNRTILVNDKEYFIKGVCYDPVPIGTEKRSFNNIDKDLKLMKEAGINTIRVYSPIDNISVLNKIDDAGIKVIIGFGYNQDGYYDILTGSFTNYVEKYKNHNAILFWELGN